MSDIYPPEVSVIICTNLIDKYFYRALHSIKYQIFTNLEIIIVFNGDDIQSYNSLLATNFDSRVVIVRANISGVTFSRNLGIHLARAPLIAVMDADDISYPNRINEQVNFLNNNPEISVCGTNYHVIDADDKRIQSIKLPTSDKEIRKSLYFGNPICHPSVMYRRKDIALMGGYASKYAEDYDLWLRLLDCPDIIFANLPNPLVGYRIPVISQARRSKRVYVEVAGAQLRRFLLTLNPKWLIGSIFSCLKVWIRSTRF